MGSKISWDKVIKKEAKGLNDDELDEVQDVKHNYGITKIGIIENETYCIPKDLITKYDGHKLWFNITKDQVKRQYKVAD